MQFSTVAALTALAATVSAWGNGTAVVYTTEVFTAYTTFCPASTELTYNGVTYTATESTTLTITNCPCTIVKPVTTSSVVAPTSTASSAVVYPTGTPSYLNSTIAASSVPATSVAVGTTSVKSSATATPSTISSSGANKAFALSGASLAGVLGFAAYFL